MCENVDVWISRRDGMASKCKNVDVNVNVTPLGV